MVATLSATDPDTASDLLVWSIPTGLAGGADADEFTLSSSGVLTFEAGKDYESPDDADADGTYGVVVQVSDGVEWSLSGDDSDDFAIDGGVLRFAATPDYEEHTPAA